MSLDWGEGNQNRGLPSGTYDEWLAGSGFSEMDSENLSKLGGLLGKLKAPKFMTDDKGFFQGGEKGRIFGRARDWLDDKFGWGDDDSEDDLEDNLEGKKWVSNRPKVNLTDDDDEFWEDDIEDFEDFEDDPIDDPFGNAFLEVDDPSQPDEVFTHGVDPVFSYRNFKYGQGRDWRKGYDVANIQHWSPNLLGDKDEETKNLFGGGPIKTSPFSYNNPFYGGGTNLSFDNNFSLTGNNYVHPYSFLSQFTPGSGEYNAAISGMDYSNELLSGWGFPTFDADFNFEDINPSDVDSDLQGSKYSWNTGGGQNWRGNY
tara:strand:- start:180 stop:1121 length:942 start_codon:yes stop_codon:yes gene_type:complete